MRLLLFIPLLLLVSCKKDKVPPPCMGISMTGDRELFVGKWRWYSTTVEEWFDVGPSNYLNYTPQNQGFEYYFTISFDGLFKGYRNDTLIEQFVLDQVVYESYNGQPVEAIQFTKNCTNTTMDLSHYYINATNDSIWTTLFPINFDDQENHLKSLRNFFVKE